MVQKLFKKWVLVVLSVVTVSAVAGVLWFYTFKKEPPKSEAITAPQMLEQAKDLQKRGETLFKQRIYGSQIAVYERLVAKTPQSLDLKKKLAFLYFAADKFEEARPLLKEVVASKLADAEVFYELGHIEKSRDYLKQALELDPNHKKARELLETIK